VKGQLGEDRLSSKGRPGEDSQGNDICHRTGRLEQVRHGRAAVTGNVTGESIVKVALKVEPGKECHDECGDRTAIVGQAGQAICDSRAGTDKPREDCRDRAAV
jgi:hypothetical protein